MDNASKVLEVARNGCIGFDTQGRGIEEMIGNHIARKTVTCAGAEDGGPHISDNKFQMVPFSEGIRF